MERPVITEMATSTSPHSAESMPSRPPALYVRGRAVHAPAQAREPRLPYLTIAPVMVLLVGIMLPVEVRVNLAGQTFYAYRIAWLLVAPWLLFQVLVGRFQFRFNDGLVLLAAFWMTLSFSVVEGIAKGFPAGLALALDVLMPYLITRHCLRSLNDFRCLLIVFAPIALGVAVLMILESVTHTRFIRSAAQAVFGSLTAAEYGNVAFKAGGIDIRYGLMRAMGPFSHPILAGLFYAGLMPLYYFSRLRGWPLVMGLMSGVGALFSLSSAALLGLAMFAVLAGYEWLRKLISFLNWPLFLAAAGTVLTLLQLLSSNGLLGLIIRYTVDPKTGYYRLLIWEYGSKSVAKYPWFGIGYDPFEKLIWMNDSVDTVWLAIAIRNGLPPALLLGAAMLLAIVSLMRAASLGDPGGRLTVLGIAISLSILFTMGFTVSFFGGLLIWFAMMLAIGTNFGHPLSQPQRSRQKRYHAR